MRVVKFRSGRRRRMWVDNVVAIGNSGGVRRAAGSDGTDGGLPKNARRSWKRCAESALERPRPWSISIIDILWRRWDEIRDFLRALHYKLNDAIGHTVLGSLPGRTLKWDGSILCSNSTAENGPSGLARYRCRVSREPLASEGWL